MKLCASVTLALSVGRTPLIMCFMIVGLTSCQSFYDSPYPAYMQNQWYQRPLTYALPPPAKAQVAMRSSDNKVQRKSTVKGVVANAKSKRLPKPQSTYIDPPLPTSGYTARLDYTPYPIMGNKPFYRVLSPNERWNMPEPAFWYWRGEVEKHGINPKVLIRMFDPYSPSAPPASTLPRR